MIYTKASPGCGRGVQINTEIGDLVALGFAVFEVDDESNVVTFWADEEENPMPLSVGITPPDISARVFESLPIEHGRLFRIKAHFERLEVIPAHA